MQSGAALILLEICCVQVHQWVHAPAGAPDAFRSDRVYSLPLDLAICCLSLRMWDWALFFFFFLSQKAKGCCWRIRQLAECKALCFHVKFLRNDARSHFIKVPHERMICCDQAHFIFHKSTFRLLEIPGSLWNIELQWTVREQRFFLSTHFKSCLVRTYCVLKKKKTLWDLFLKENKQTFQLAWCKGGGGCNLSNDMLNFHCLLSSHPNVNEAAEQPGNI